MDVAGASYVGDEDQVEVRVAIDGEPYSTLLHTGYPAKILSQKIQSHIWFLLIGLMFLTFHFMGRAVGTVGTT